MLSSTQNHCLLTRRVRIPVTLRKFSARAVLSTYLNHLQYHIFLFCSSNPCLLGGDGSRSDLLVDQKGHLGGRILQSQHQLFSHQQCLKIKINRQFIFSSLINKAETISSYLKRCGEDADNVNPAPPPRSILVLIGNVRILPESGRQNLWGYR